jgi:hypothetical protein
MIRPTTEMEADCPRNPQQRVRKRGQVAQVVERSPEKAGVGGSTPSLATNILRINGFFLLLIHNIGWNF